MLHLFRQLYLLERQRRVRREDKRLTQYLIREQIKLRLSFNYYRFNQIFDSIAHQWSDDDNTEELLFAKVILRGGQLPCQPARFSVRPSHGNQHFVWSFSFRLLRLLVTQHLFLLYFSQSSILSL